MLMRLLMPPEVSQAKVAEMAREVAVVVTVEVETVEIAEVEMTVDIVAESAVTALIALNALIALSAPIVETVEKVVSPEKIEVGAQEPLDFLEKRVDKDIPDLRVKVREAEAASEEVTEVAAEAPIL